MSLPIRSSRRTAALLTALSGALLAACAESDGILPPSGPRAAALQVVSRNPPLGVAGYQLPDSIVVRAVDAQGRPVAGIRVHTDASWPAQLVLDDPYTNAQGYAQVAWHLAPTGEPRGTLRVDGAPVVELRAQLATVPDVARPMLGLLGAYIPNNAQMLEDILPRNQHIVDYIRAKITILRTPGLGTDVLEQGRWELGSILSRSGAVIPVVSLFPLETMRGEAADAIRLIESTVPVLEEFFDGSFPAPPQGGVRLWYGFVTGMSGGGGVISVEDRTTYELRTQGGRALPYDPGITHELGHSYVGTESLAQFLEIYGHNVLRTGSKDVSRWTYTRSWTPQRADNKDVHAMLDVYELIGPEAMARAFRAVVPLRPAYGQPLSPAVQQVFIDAAPASVRAQVAARVARVTF
jgi:hypothetical protein